MTAIFCADFESGISTAAVRARPVYMNCRRSDAKSDQILDALPIFWTDQARFVMHFYCLHDGSKTLAFRRNL